jgi:hypothetical protein
MGLLPQFCRVCCHNPAKFLQDQPQVHGRDSLRHIHSFKAALAVAKARLSLERQQTLKVLPRTLTPEQTTAELGVRGAWSVG